RRRHTRSYGDWSSDVCSSDLLVPRQPGQRQMPRDAPSQGWKRLAKLPELIELGLARLLLPNGMVKILLAPLGVATGGLQVAVGRSEERRVGKEGRARLAAAAS